MLIEAGENNLNNPWVRGFKLDAVKLRKLTRLS